MYAALVISKQSRSLMARFCWFTDLWPRIMVTISPPLIYMTVYFWSPPLESGGGGAGVGPRRRTHTRADNSYSSPQLVGCGPAFISRLVVWTAVVTPRLNLSLLVRIELFIVSYFTRNSNVVQNPVHRTSFLSEIAFEPITNFHHK